MATAAVCWLGLAVTTFSPYNVYLSGSDGPALEDLTLADRVFRCQRPECGLALDRDLNAAIDFAKLAGSSSARQHACGEESAGVGLRAQVKLSPLQQEPNAFDASAKNGKCWRTMIPSVERSFRKLL